MLCNVTPESALATITGRSRTPLTIAEGIALVTQRPDMLRKNKCFSLLATRRGGQKVPAIWISNKAPSSVGAGTATCTRGWGLPRRAAAPERSRASVPERDDLLIGRIQIPVFGRLSILLIGSAIGKRFSRA